jgi:Type II secretion system (T2SS), protein G
VSTVWRRRLILIGFLVLGGIALLTILQDSQSRILLDHERGARVAADIHALACEIDAYRNRIGSLPAGLDALAYAPKDPWHSAYIYRHPGVHNRNSYDLFSSGPDQKPDTPDDDWGEQ